MAETFNEAELMDQVDGDVEFLADTVEMLTEDGPELVRQLGEALDAGDADSVGRIAHTIKGMVSNFCASQAQSVALELEQAGKSGDLGAAPAIFDRLREQLDRLAAELAEFIRARS